MRTGNPYIKPYHMATHFAQDNSGRVSALCFKVPKAINLKKALWVMREEGVTCKKCLKLLKEV